MARSLKKGPYVDERLLGRVMKMDESGRSDAVKTWSRSCDIVPEFVGHAFLVHNGKVFVRVHVSEDMVGHKLGEFAPTRLFRSHSGGRK